MKKKKNGEFSLCDSVPAGNQTSWSKTRELEERKISRMEREPLKGWGEMSAEVCLNSNSI